MEETTTTRIARCLCGALTATTRGDPARVLMCSCLDCRRKSGSAFAVATYWPEEAVDIDGPTRRFRRDTDSGRSLEYQFCPGCGVALIWRADFAPGSVGIGAGNFPDSAFAVPTVALWTEQRPPWVETLAQVPAMPRQ